MDDGSVAVVPGPSDFLSDEVAQELSRVLRTGAISWCVENEERVAGTVYDDGEELLEYNSNPLPPTGRQEFSP